MHAKVLLTTVQHRTDPTVIGITLLQTVNDTLCTGSFVILFWFMHVRNTPTYIYVVW